MSEPSTDDLRVGTVTLCCYRSAHQTWQRAEKITIIIIVSSLSGTDLDCRRIARESKLRSHMQHRRRGTWLQWRLIVETGFWRYHYELWFTAR